MASEHSPSYYLAVHPQGRDASLLRTHRHRVKLPIPAESLTRLLVGADTNVDAPFEGWDERASYLVRRLRRVLGSHQRNQVSAPPASRPVLLAVDDSIIRMMPGAALTMMFGLTGLQPEVVSTDSVRDRVGSDPAVITLTESFDLERFSIWEDQFRRSGQQWAYFFLTEHGAGFGPYLEEGSPGPRDLASRWVTAAHDEYQARARLNAPELRIAGHTIHDLLPVVGAFACDVSRWLHGGEANGDWHHVEFGQEGMVRHPVLPLPPTSAARHASLVPRDVLDRQTGIVVDVRPIRLGSAVPRGVHYVESRTADMSRIRPWAANIYNAGSSWDDPELAELGAIGEAVERYCGNVYKPNQLRWKSFRELVRCGDRAVDPRQLVLFSARQYDDRGLPFVRFDPDLRTSWTLGRSLVDDGEIWVPASEVFVNWNSGDSIFDPPTNPAFYPGIAAGTEYDLALCNALEEVIERDASMVWWLSGAVLPTLAPWNFAEDRTTAGSAISMSFVPIQNEFDVPVIAAVADDAETGLCTVGLASRHTAELAARKALLEALGLLETAKDLQRHDGGFWQALHRAGAPAQPVKAIRADRRYLDEYREDFRDVTDLYCQLQIQLDPRARGLTTQRWTDHSRTSWDELPSLTERTSRLYVDALARHGVEPICVDLTTSDVRSAGWHAVRVLAPGLVPNFPTAFPPLGRGRVLEQPVPLGWRKKPLEPAEVYSFPMPYA